MRIEYTPDDRYSPWYSPIGMSCNSTHVDAYLILDGPVRLKALQVMRDNGLLPNTHRMLMRLRRAYHNARIDIDALRALAHQDYQRYWTQYMAAKQQAIDIRRNAEEVYNAMFFSPQWQAEKAAQNDGNRQLPLFEVSA